MDYNIDCNLLFVFRISILHKKKVTANFEKLKYEKTDAMRRFFLLDIRYFLTGIFLTKLNSSRKTQKTVLKLIFNLKDYDSLGTIPSRKKIPAFGKRIFRITIRFIDFQSLPSNKFFFSEKIKTVRETITRFEYNLHLALQQSVRVSIKRELK